MAHFNKNKRNEHIANESISKQRLKLNSKKETSSFLKNLKALDANEEPIINSSEAFINQSKIDNTKIAVTNKVKFESEKTSIAVANIKPETPKKEIKKPENLVSPSVIQAENQNLKEEPNSKNNIIKYVFILFFLVLLAFLACYFYSKTNNNVNFNNNELSALEKNKVDSTLNFEEETRIQNLESIQDSENSIRIADRIFQLKSQNPKAYYVIIGSFKTMNKAVLLKQKEKDAYIFDQEKIRVGIRIFADENEVLDVLAKIRLDYSDAWLVYNQN